MFAIDGVETLAKTKIVRNDGLTLTYSNSHVYSTSYVGTGNQSINAISAYVNGTSSTFTKLEGSTFTNQSNVVDGIGVSYMLVI